MNVRKFCLKTDKNWLLDFNASFSSDFVCRVNVKGISVEIIKEKLERPFEKSYCIKDIERETKKSDYCVVAEHNDQVHGFAFADFEEWNKSVLLQGIFVLPESKGKSIGKTLLNEILEFAKSVDSDRIRLETQNTNVPAIEFYLKNGFHFCGFDNSLYDENLFPDEIAFYFCRFL